MPSSENNSSQQPREESHHDMRNAAIAGGLVGIGLIGAGTIFAGTRWFLTSDSPRVVRLRERAGKLLGLDRAKLKKLGDGLVSYTDDREALTAALNKKYPPHLFPQEYTDDGKLRHISDQVMGEPTIWEGVRDWELYAHYAALLTSPLVTERGLPSQPINALTLGKGATIPVIGECTLGPNPKVHKINGSLAYIDTFAIVPLNVQILTQLELERHHFPDGSHVTLEGKIAFIHTGRQSLQIDLSIEDQGGEKVKKRSGPVWRRRLSTPEVKRSYIDRGTITFGKYIEEAKP